MCIKIKIRILFFLVFANLFTRMIGTLNSAIFIYYLMFTFVKLFSWFFKMFCPFQNIIVVFINNIKSSVAFIQFYMKILYPNNHSLGDINLPSVFRLVFGFKQGHGGYCCQITVQYVSKSILDILNTFKKYHNIFSRNSNCILYLHIIAHFKQNQAIFYGFIFFFNQISVLSILGFS